MREKLKDDASYKRYLLLLIPDRKPGSLMYSLFHAFAVLLDSSELPWRKYNVDENEKNLTRFLLEMGNRYTLRMLRSELEETTLLLRINEEKVKKVEEFFKKMSFDFGMLKNEPGNKNWFGFWIKSMFDCAQKRLGLSEKCQEAFDEIYLNALDSLKEELIRVNRCKNAFIVPRLCRKFEGKGTEFGERTHALVKMSKNSQEELSYLQWKLRDLEYKLKNILKEDGIKISTLSK